MVSTGGSPEVTGRVGRGRGRLATGLLATGLLVGLLFFVLGAPPVGARVPTAITPGDRSDPTPIEAGAAHLTSPASPQPLAAFTITLYDPVRWTPARGTEPAHPGRYLRTTVVYPTTPGPWPIIGFAHGFASMPADYLALLERIAAGGYVVVAPEFPISVREGNGPPRRDDIPNQPGDVSYALTWARGAAVDPGSLLFGVADGDRMGAVGHSDGGITTAAMALNSATLDPRLRGTAVLAGGTWLIPGGSWGPFNAGPVLVQQSWNDTVNPYALGVAPYDFAAGPRARSSFVGDHLAGYLTEPVAAGVQAELVAFLDATVRGDVRGTSRLAEIVNDPANGLSWSSDGLTPEPVGNLDGVTRTADGTYRLMGWAADPDTTDPVAVHVYADGGFLGLLDAELPRPDVAATHPELGGTVGFSASLAALADGPHTVCAYAINQRWGSFNPSLGCVALVVDNNPFGNLESVHVDPAAATVTTRGWAIDPDTSAPIAIHVYVDGMFRASAAADRDRPDVGAAFPGHGSAHGFDIPLGGLTDGEHQVCLYAINALAGTANTTLGCRSVTVPHNPFGNLEAVAPEAPTSPASLVVVRGWAIDPDTTAPVAVHVYVDGVGAGVLTADQDRPDVAAAFPGAGAAHGFAGSVPAVGHGNHTVCLYAINAGAGSANTTLGCRVVGMDRNPFGNTEGLLGMENASFGPDWYLTGWAIDPDSTGPTTVHVYRDGTIAGVATTSSFFTRRDDVAALWPAYGTLREWQFHVYSGMGDPPWHELCAYAINEGPGSANVLLGCLHR